MTHLPLTNSVIYFSSRTFQEWSGPCRDSHLVPLFLWLVLLSCPWYARTMEPPLGNPIFKNPANKPSVQYWRPTTREPPISGQGNKRGEISYVNVLDEQKHLFCTVLDASRYWMTLWMPIGCCECGLMLLLSRHKVVLEAQPLAEQASPDATLPQLT